MRLALLSAGLQAPAARTCSGFLSRRASTQCKLPSSYRTCRTCMGASVGSAPAARAWGGGFAASVGSAPAARAWGGGFAASVGSAPAARAWGGWLCSECGIRTCRMCMGGWLRSKHGIRTRLQDARQCGNRSNAGLQQAHPWVPSAELHLCGSGPGADVRDAPYRRYRWDD
eukprot:365811-Chlamydomonas_euryale.AAC.33